MLGNVFKKECFSKIFLEIEPSEECNLKKNVYQDRKIYFSESSSSFQELSAFKDLSKSFKTLKLKAYKFPWIFIILPPKLSCITIILTVSRDSNHKVKGHFLSVPHISSRWRQCVVIPLPNAFQLDTFFNYLQKFHLARSIALFPPDAMNNPHRWRLNGQREGDMHAEPKPKIESYVYANFLRSGKCIIFIIIISLALWYLHGATLKVPI